MSVQDLLEAEIQSIGTMSVSETCEDDRSSFYRSQTSSFASLPKDAMKWVPADKLVQRSQIRSPVNLPKGTTKLVPANALVQRHRQGEAQKRRNTEPARPISPCNTDSTSTRSRSSRRLIQSWRGKVYSVIEDAAKSLALEADNDDESTNIHRIVSEPTLANLLTNGRTESYANMPEHHMVTELTKPCPTTTRRRRVVNLKGKISGIMEDVTKSLAPEMRDTTCTDSSFRTTGGSLRNINTGPASNADLTPDQKLTALLLAEGNRSNIAKALQNHEDFDKLKKSMRESGVLLHAGAKEKMIQWAQSA